MNSQAEYGPVDAVVKGLCSSKVTRLVADGIKARFKQDDITANTLYTIECHPVNGKSHGLLARLRDGVPEVAMNLRVVNGNVEIRRPTGHFAVLRPQPAVSNLGGVQGTADVKANKFLEVLRLLVQKQESAAGKADCADPAADRAGPADPAVDKADNADAKLVQALKQIQELKESQAAQAVLITALRQELQTKKIWIEEFLAQQGGGARATAKALLTPSRRKGCELGDDDAPSNQKRFCASPPPMPDLDEVVILQCSAKKPQSITIKSESSSVAAAPSHSMPAAASRANQVAMNDAAAYDRAARASAEENELAQQLRRQRREQELAQGSLEELFELDSQWMSWFTPLAVQWMEALHSRKLLRSFLLMKASSIKAYKQPHQRKAVDAYFDKVAKDLQTKSAQVTCFPGHLF